MKRILGAIGLALVLLLPAYAAPANPIIGTWDCVSVEEHGTQVSWALTVNEDKGQLSGFIMIGEDRVDLLEPKLDGNAFSFRIKINPQETVDISLKVDGNKLEGRFSGKDSGTGTVTGQKKQA